MAGRGQQWLVTLLTFEERSIQCRTHTMHLIQILLPRTASPANQAEGDHFARTRAELTQAFDGVTAYLRAPAQGTWVAPDGATEHDEMVMVEVLTETFDRAWWREYARTLAERFGQQAIHIRVLPADVP
jgi:hypothetical protein